MVNWAIFLFTTSDTRARHALFQTHIAESPNRPQYDVARHGRFLIVTDLQDAVTELTHHLKLAPSAEIKAVSGRLRRRTATKSGSAVSGVNYFVGGLIVAEQCGKTASRAGDGGNLR